MGALEARQIALVNLGGALRAVGYRFVTPTPETHRRVNARPENAQARNLRDIFGWSRPFERTLLPDALLRFCEAAQILVPSSDGGLCTSAVRFSTLESASGDLLLVHSAYPTDHAEAVFFGPDSYRFAALLTRSIWKAQRLVDVGCGTGVGGLVLGARADQIVLADVSPGALDFAAVNVALAGRDPATITVMRSDVLAQIEGDFDVVVANPPYLVDARARLYRDGGGALGLALAERIASESLHRLSAGGTLVLYTGTPIVDGQNILADSLQPLLRERASAWTWCELDPDVFGEELDHLPYRQTERLAVMALVATAAA
jgi:methylase of polypeptide subunit release factors